MVEETQYPFGETIDFSVRATRPVRFALQLRIPGWCREATVSINGKPFRGALKSGSFARVERVFENNDRIRLRLPMELKVSRWPDSRISIERGPLVYALKIDEQWQVDRKEKSPSDFPVWNLYAGSAWNYALCLDGADLAAAIKVVHRPVVTHPWSNALAPVELHVPARKVAGWSLIRTKRVWRKDNVTFPPGLKTFLHKGNFCLTPPLPDPETLPERLSKREETVVLVPYGCTQLRITVFPCAKSLKKRRG